MILNLPFTALRAFEVVVRRSSFSAAAEELGVSQSAISQQVKALEEWLGQDLLTRGARQSVPTRDGETLARAIAEGLGRISETCIALRDRKRSNNTIVISCLPGFAFTWLFPRLLRFDMEHPELSISITTDTGQHPFTARQADIGIRYGFGDSPGFHVERLMEERIFPVCAPALITPDAPANVEAFLATNTLLHDELADFKGSQPTWSYWAQECGVDQPKPAGSRRFGLSNMVIEAAINGLGVALGREPLVIDALFAGRLVRPYPQIAKSQLSYWLVYPPRAEETPKIYEFLNWIRREVREQPDIPPHICRDS